MDAEVRKTVAWHEAGHAIIMLRLGVSVRYVTLAARDGVAAVTPGPPPPKFWYRHMLAIHAAGAIAESLVNGDRYDMAYGAAHDMRMLRDGARRTWKFVQKNPEHPDVADLPDGATVLRIAELAWGTAFDLVLEHLGAIAAAAEALADSRRALRGAQLRRIADAAAPMTVAVTPADRAFWPAEYCRLKWAAVSPRKVSVCV